LKVALVNPPYGLSELVGKSKSMKAVMNVIQPLGLGYIAALLERNGHEVAIEDSQCLNLAHETLVTRVAGHDPDVVGISTTTPTFGSSLVTARLIKDRIPGVPIVIGGAHVSAVPDLTMAYDCFDIGVIGEGDYTTLELMEHIDKNGLNELENIQGIVFKKDGRFYQTERRPFIKNLDELPFPARHLLPSLHMYHPAPTSYKRLPNAHVFTSRGCAGAHCLFCDRGGFGFSVRFRSVENVFDEIEELINIYGARDLKIYDDTFTIDKKRVLRICEEFRKRKIDIPWCCLARTNTVNREILQAMKQAGCWEILFGIESMDETVLSKLMKFTTVEQNIRAVKLCDEIGLSVRANYIVGTPFDTMESMQKDLEGAIALNTDFAHFNKFEPYPGSEFYKMLSDQGYAFDFVNWESHHDLKGALLYVPNGVVEQEYRDWLVKAHKRYYLRPKYIAKQLSSIRSAEDIRRLWQGMQAVAFL
jgi:anaerobic magnesium-protoporphyrin IX monomethyl ester cyclase